MFRMDRQCKIQLVRCYYSSNCSATGALRLYKKENNLKNYPFKAYSITRVLQRFEETGSVDDRPRSGRPSFTDNTVESVKNTVEKQSEENVFGHCSTGRVAAECGVKHTTVWKIMRKN